MQNLVMTLGLMYMMNLGLLLYPPLHHVSSILAFLLQIGLLIVVVAPYPSPLHYPYYSDHYYFVLCFLELAAQVLQVVWVLLERLEPLLMATD